jgi:nitrate/nitrite-specific signal transduction histidine kinase
MIIFVVIFSIVIFLINFLLRRNVISPVGNIAAVAEKVSTGSITDEELKSERLHSIVDRGDELGQLSRIFEKMAHEVITREQRLREQVAQLRIEVDEAKKTSEVQRIVESDYFQDLQERAKKMRKRAGKDQDAQSDKTDSPE